MHLHYFSVSLCSDVAARKLIATYVSPLIVLVHRCAQLLTAGPALCQHS